jgi:hypothetical protein
VAAQPRCRRGAVQPRIELGGFMPSSGQRAALRGVGVESCASPPAPTAWHAGGQHQAVAVEDAAAAGRQRLRVHEALLALGLVEVGGRICSHTARPSSTAKASATSTTTKRERHGGVLLASSGLVA